MSSIAQTIDLIANPSVVSVERANQFDFTQPVYVERAFLVQPMPTLRSRSLAVIKPFQSMVLEFSFSFQLFF